MTHAHNDIYTMDNGRTFTDPCPCPIGHDHPESECQGGHVMEREEYTDED